MYSKKTLVAAAALAVLSAAGIGSASAAPWNHNHPGPVMQHRHFVERARIDEALRFRHFRMVGTPYFLHGHYVVRTHDRFGRLVVVEIDPSTGAFLGEFRI